MDRVRVHRGSAEPARIGALAHARGADIHLGPGQERHLPHEAWHVVQQAQGRVRPTMQLKRGDALNDDSSLEREADAMGGLALRTARTPVQAAAFPAMSLPRPPRSAGVLQAYRAGTFAAEEASGTAQQLHSQSPAPEIQPADKAGLPPTPTKIAYPQQQTPADSARFRVADDLSLAVQATTNEPKEFFAKNTVFVASNTMLAANGSSLRLKKAGGQIRFDATTLPKIRPENSEAPDGAEFASLWSDICIEIANHIMGNRGSWTEDVVLQSGKLKGSATISSDALASAGIDRLAEHLGDDAPQPEDAKATLDTALGAIKPDKLDQRPGKAYGLASADGGLSGKASRLGVNEFAKPEVGEGFATFSVFSQDKSATDYTSGRRRSRAGKDIWGYHHAAVVARSVDGKDWMTLENYNRTPQIKDKVYQYLLQKYSRVAGRKQRELKRAGKTAEQIAQDLQYYLFAQREDASADYQRIVVRDSKIDGTALWFFRMYGSGAGQSFHEQQATSGGYVNPLTVRVRKNVVGQHLEKLSANERAIDRSIAAAQIDWLPARDALDTLHTATTQAFAEMRAKLDDFKDRRSEAQLALGLQQVNARYTKWLNQTFVPGMADALHAIKRGTLGPRPATLGGLKAQANSPERLSKASGAAHGAWDTLSDLAEHDLRSRHPRYKGNLSADRVTSLKNLRAAIDNVPRKAV